MQTNLTKQKLTAGHTVLGCFSRYADAGLIEFLGYQGWDFLVLDAEHGSLEPRDCENLVRACELRGVTPIVRVTTNQPPVILRYMDIGAHGAQIPFINTLDDAAQAVRSLKFHPLGNRGLAGTRAAHYAQDITFTEHCLQSNRETLLVAQIETEPAIKHLAEITKLDGVDVIFIGPNDLSHSLGLPGQIQHPLVQDAMKRIADIVLPSGKALGLMATSVENAREWQLRGARYLTVTIESILGPAVRRFIDEFRKP